MRLDKKMLASETVFKHWFLILRHKVLALGNEEFSNFKMNFQLNPGTNNK